MCKYTFVSVSFELWCLPYTPLVSHKATVVYHMHPPLRKEIRRAPQLDSGRIQLRYKCIYIYIIYIYIYMAVST